MAQILDFEEMITIRGQKQLIRGQIVQNANGMV